MGLTLSVGNREIMRQADLAFRQRDYKIFLVLNEDGNLTVDTPASFWLAAELDIVENPGYYAQTGQIGAAIWNDQLSRAFYPEITGVFKADGGDMVYDTVCFWLYGEDYLHSINVEDPVKTLISGQVSAYSYSFQNFASS